MTQTYLMTAIEVKTFCPSINNEVDNAIISGAILLIQDTELKFSLTQDFYEDVISNSGTTANKYLIDNYCKYIIAYSVWQYLVTTLTYQTNSSGLRIKTSDHSQAAEATDMIYVRNYIQNFIDNVRKEMSRYIFDHQSDYPLYYSDKWGDTPAKNDFRIGRVGGGSIYMPKTENEYPYWRTTK